MTIRVEFSDYQTIRVELSDHMIIRVQLSDHLFLEQQHVSSCTDLVNLQRDWLSILALFAGLGSYVANVYQAVSLRLAESMQIPVVV